MAAGGGGAEEDTEERLRSGRMPAPWRVMGHFGRRAESGNEGVFFFYDRVGRGEEAMTEGDCAAVGGRWVYLRMLRRDVCGGRQCGSDFFW